MADFPLIFRVRQHFQRPLVSNVDAETQSQLSGLNLKAVIKPGQTVAITAGSRGITNIRQILKSLVEHLKNLDGVPFIVPAMGSHGGGTAEGQMQLLSELGITEQFCGCPIRASMDTVIVCHAAEGFPVHFDRHAFEADHVFVCGRVKPHTNFVGENESGLMKMMLVGLGKHEGAKVYHRAITQYSFGQILQSVAHEVLARCRILGGLAIVENGYDQTALIEAVRPQEFQQREAHLLKLAKQWLPRLPFDRADVLLVDEIGKNFSGTGMDTNVIGRKYLHHQAREDEWPKIKSIIVRGLSSASHGNGAGIGLAEFALTRVIAEIDMQKTYVNALTANHPEAAMIPIHRLTDLEVIQDALSINGLTAPQDARLMWISNTLELVELACSSAYWQEAQVRKDLEILEQPRPLPFNHHGMLLKLA